MTSLHHTSALNSLDPADPQLSDLEPLRNSIAGARIVGIGEGAHFVREFTLARARLLRYLVEQCGFTSLAFELGYTEATKLNPWLAGDGTDADLPELARPLTLAVFGELLRWLRSYNRGRSAVLHIVGIDLPTTLNLSPDLDAVAAYLRELDPPSVALLDDVLPAADEITGGSAVVSASQWSALGVARQESLSAGLARLSLRLRAMGPLYLRSGRRRDYAAACRHVASAVHTDYQLRAMSDFFAGNGLPCDPSLREYYLATTVQEQLAAPDTRIVVVAHNNHIQKTPVTFDGELAALPMGHYLAQSLGEGYRAVALTHTGDRVPEMAFPAADSPVGFTVNDVELAAPQPGSVERALVDAGLGDSITLTDLRKSEFTFTAIRSQSAVVDTDLHQAFDAVLSSPTATRDATVTF
ncbi:erythromycin esterase family protein [Cryptosporangium sp. NPDC048952]|uniref:erythromycin esterase family protein n=1 Tax=Cryptosporangium sp. NPDC048952 TaxID=3363961 RepID=UPI00372148CD